MARYVKIELFQKINEGLGIYAVKDDYGAAFYVSVDLQTRIAKISQDQNFTEPSLIDFKDKEGKIDVPWVEPHTLYAVVIKVEKMIDRQGIEKVISFCS